MFVVRKMRVDWHHGRKGSSIVISGCELWVPDCAKIREHYVLCIRYENLDGETITVTAPESFDVGCNNSFLRCQIRLTDPLIGSTMYIMLKPLFIDVPKKCDCKLAFCTTYEMLE